MWHNSNNRDPHTSCHYNTPLYHASPGKASNGKESSRHQEMSFNASPGKALKGRDNSCHCDTSTSITASPGEASIGKDVYCQRNETTLKNTWQNAIEQTPSLLGTLC
jgi:hypothetical protein